MKEPTLKSTVISMMPESFTPRLKNALFRSFKKDYAPKGVAWNAKISDVRESVDFLLDAFLEKCKADMKDHIDRFLYRN